MRERELYPLALANESEVYEAYVGRGVRIILFGMLPERRLPIETDYGAFVVKNGMPIGYGVGALLFDQLEIAVNIFPTFRSGESSFVFEQFTRLFHHQFGSKVFLVERYQLGHENDEGLDAGSFWFYHKLGFRPVDPKVHALAAKEAERIRARPGYRSSRSMLKRLAESNVVLHLDDPRGDAGERGPPHRDRPGGEPQDRGALRGRSRGGGARVRGGGRPPPRRVRVEGPGRKASGPRSSA